MTERERARRRLAAGLLEELKRMQQTFGMMAVSVSSMQEDSGDQWRLSLVGMSRRLQSEAKVMEQRARRLLHDVKDEMKRGDVVRSNREQL